MKKIAVFDTSISDYNLGNQIIMDSVNKYLNELFPTSFFFKLPFLEICKPTIEYINQSDYTFFGGTNSLTSRMEKYKQWGVNLFNSRYIKNVILMGIGWWQYQEKESFYTKVLLKRVLSQEFFHSVRDTYTEKKLKKIGFNNVINTGCPTLWGLTPDYCREIKQEKSEDVIFTFTDYHQDIKRDSMIFDILRKNYRKMYFWIQGVGDYEYIKRFQQDNIEIIDPNLKAFDEALCLDIDYVGTRLHAGIRALQSKKRALIISVDNRAIEMKQDFNIPVVDQNDVEKLESYINSVTETKITIPIENINKWKQQFSN